jgi:hypothetical protein
MATFSAGFIVPPLLKIDQDPGDQSGDLRATRIGDFGHLLQLFVTERSVVRVRWIMRLASSIACAPVQSSRVKKSVGDSPTMS